MSADIVQIGKVPKIIPHEIELGTAETPVSGNINKQVTFDHPLLIGRGWSSLYSNAGSHGILTFEDPSGGYLALTRGSPTSTHDFKISTQTTQRGLAIGLGTFANDVSVAGSGSFGDASWNQTSAPTYGLTVQGSIGMGTNVEFALGETVIAIANASVVPSGTPTGGGVLYVESGALKYVGSSGTITTLANA
tara:strand:- start:5232 stop:5807 length:576 start_codon:yes stop_codon:yes gene_type:complete